MKESYTQEQFDKLPKWARDAIDRGKRHIQELRTQLIQMSAENTGTDTFVEVLMDDNRRINLPAHSTVTFLLGKERDERIDVRVGRDGRVPYLHVAGRGTIAIFPRSGNLVHITVPPRSVEP